MSNRVKLTTRGGACLWAVAAFSLSILLTDSAVAVCSQTKISGDDTAFLAKRGGHSADFLNFYVDAYRIRSSKWDDRGFFDATNVRKEFFKHSNAAALIVSSARIPQSEIVIFPGFGPSRPRHGALDYLSQTEGKAFVPPGTGEPSPCVGHPRSCQFDPVVDLWHTVVLHRASDSLNFSGEFEERPFRRDDIINTTCFGFEDPVGDGGVAGTLTFRAGILVHEGGHSTNTQHGFRSDHRAGPRGDCTREKCDFWYPHALRDFRAGELWPNESRFHSVFQYELEFYCDLAETPDDRVTLSVRESAASAFSSLGISIINQSAVPGCAVPSPLGGPPADPGGGECGVFDPCTSNADCDFGSACFPVGPQPDPPAPLRGCCFDTPR